MASANASKTTTATETRDNSVLFALGELARLESDRVADEKARAEARQAEARRAAEREAAEREEASRREADREAKTRAIAEAEARLKVEAELAQDARMIALKAELARVQAEREQMHRSVLDASRPAVAPPAPTRAWALAFGLSSVVAAALAALLVVQAHEPPRVVEVERQVVVTMPAPLATQALEAEAAPEAAPLAAAEPPAPAPLRTPRRDPRTTRTTRHVPTTSTSMDDGLGFGDDDDVISGLEHDDTSMFTGRR
jgi:hypothetical protein